MSCTHPLPSSCPADLPLRREDYTPFASPHFNVNAYANAILADEPYNPDAAGQQAGEAAGAGEHQPRRSTASKGKAREDGGFGTGAGAGGASLTPKGDIGLALAKLNYGIVSKQQLNA